MRTRCRVLGISLAGVLAAGPAAAACEDLVGQPGYAECVNAARSRDARETETDRAIDRSTDEERRREQDQEQRLNDLERDRFIDRVHGRDRDAGAVP